MSACGASRPEQPDASGPFLTVGMSGLGQFNLAMRYEAEVGPLPTFGTADSGQPAGRGAAESSPC